VRWHESIIRLVESGCDAAVEVGPGRVLTGLLKRMDGAPAASNVETADDLESAVCDLAG
jgi:[acyl-carrier-protein] S-malonyltransferase